MADLRLIKWNHHLNEHFWSDDRFRSFLQNGVWFNPFTNTPENTIRKDGTVISRGCIGEIARILAALPQADPGRLASLQGILSKHPELSPQEEDDNGGEVTIDSGDFTLGGSGNLNDDFLSDSPEELFNGGITGKPALTPLETPAPQPTPIPELTFENDAIQPELEVITTSHDNDTVSLGEQEDQGSQGGGFHDNDSDLAQAAKVQQQLLGDIPDIAHAEIALHYEPCHYVGGDFYDFIQLKDGRWFILMGDVSGHGVQAAMVVQSIIKALRFICHYATNPDVVEIMATLNDSVKNDLISGQFFTCFAGIIDTSNPEKTVIEAACCGHHPSIIVNAYGPTYMRSVGTKGMAVGLSTGKMLQRVTKVDVIELLPGDALFVWTDGLSEAMNAESEEFGDWRTRAACIAHADQDIKVQVDALVEYVLSFSEGVRQDDMSVLALRVPHPDDPSPETEDDGAAD